MSTTVKSELLGMKAKLEMIEANLAKQSKQIDERDDKWSKMETNIKLTKSNISQRVYLNIGGTKFTTTVSTLLSDNTSIFNKILSSKELSLTEEIYIERRGDIFEILLQYFRTGKFNYKNYNKQKLLEIKEEADFFNIEKIYNEIDELTRDIEIIGYEHSGDYIYKGKIAGTQKVEDIKTKDQSTGICAKGPNGFIILELKGNAEFQEIEIAGWAGDKNLWYPGNGSGAKIYISLDKENWGTSVGSVSSSFATKIVTIKLKEKCFAKYVKFECNTYIGFGYIYLKRIELE